MKKYENFVGKIYQRKKNSIILDLFIFNLALIEIKERHTIPFIIII